MSMSIKTNLLAAATMLTLAGGVAAAGAFPAQTAGAATATCGSRCIDFFSRQAGTYRHPNGVFAVLHRWARVGQPIVGSPASRRDPGEDFTISSRARVSEFYAAGLVTKWIALHYGGLGCQVYRPATHRCQRRYPNTFGYEIEYSPHGVKSGLCVGTPAAARNGTLVSLQRCGVSARTVWVVDLADSVGARTSRPYAALINGSQTDPSRPFLLTYPRKPRPAGLPGRQLATQALQRPARHRTVEDGQLWGAGFGALP
jgi:hypothetical protein